MVEKQKFAKYRAEKNPTYQIDSHKKEKDKLKQKDVCQGRLFNRQSFFLSQYQALEIADFKI